MLSDSTNIVIGALATGLLGGGALSGLFFYALVERLRNTFVSKESHENMVKLYEAMAGQLRSNTDAVIRLQAADEDRWRPVAETLQRITDRMEEYGKEMAEVTVTLAMITKQISKRSTDYE